MDRATALEALLAKGPETALLRYSLGTEFLHAGDAERAATHLRRATELDPGHSASWKLLGKALAALDRADEARAAWTSGIAAARAKGDRQGEKEMTVFLRRLG